MRDKLTSVFVSCVLVVAVVETVLVLLLAVLLASSA